MTGSEYVKTLTDDDLMFAFQALGRADGLSASVRRTYVRAEIARRQRAKRT